MAPITSSLIPLARTQSHDHSEQQGMLENVGQQQAWKEKGNMDTGELSQSLTQ